MCAVKVLLCLALLTLAKVVIISADPGKIIKCCEKVSTYKIRDHIVDFKIQEAHPPCVKAVIFITENGTRSCTKPNLPWVNAKIKQLRKMKEINSK